MAQNSPTILIVDDEEPIRRLYSVSLSRVGWTCHSAATHDEALEALRSAPEITTILLDYDVGGNTPDQIVNKLQAIRPEVLIVGNSAQDRREEFAALEIERFLMKPWRISEFMQFFE